MNEIYLIWDRKYGGTYKATTNRTKAYEEAKRLNNEKGCNRYKVTVMKDFATK